MYASCLQCGGHVFFSFHRAYHVQRMVDVKHAPVITSEVARAFGVHYDNVRTPPQPVLAIEGKSMSFKSFLSAVGNDAKSVFKWLGSPQGQTTISAVEGTSLVVAGAINPALLAGLTGIEALVNAGLKEVISVETVAAAAAAQSGTGSQKLAAVTTAITPNVGPFLQSIGIANPTATQVQALASAIGNGLAAILNAVPAPPTA